MNDSPILPKILAVDDDATALAYYRGFCGRFQLELVEARGASEALEKISGAIQVAIVDLNMPGMSGLELIAELRLRFPMIQVIIVSSSDSFSDAVRAIRLGVFDFLEKPVSFARLAESVGRSLARYREISESTFPVRRITSLPLVTTGELRTPKWREELNAVSGIDATVLLTGETGTGKSQAAKYIHENSERRHGPFVSVNCAALPTELIESELFGHRRGSFTGAVADRPGRAEMANDGTLFLDEVGDLPLELQPKLLTFLQDRTAFRLGSNTPYKVNCRVIAATHSDLRQRCRAKTFREDLYFRLDVMRVHLPPLRERREELDGLIREIARKVCNKLGRVTFGFSPDAMKELTDYPWPGNIRELENVLERSISLCPGPALTQADLRFLNDSTPSPDDLSSPAAVSLAGRTLAEIERQAIWETLELEGGNKARAARSLGISEKSIYNKMRRLHIEYHRSGSDDTKSGSRSEVVCSSGR